MESLRMLDEDKWPEKADLEEYESIYGPDVDYYHPNDMVVELGAWLRDNGIRERKDRVRKRREAENAQAQQRVMF